MRYVPCHEVGAHRLASALDGIEERAAGHWWDMRYGSVSLRQLREMQSELLDYVAAVARQDPALTGFPAWSGLLTAAECAHGVLTLGCFPNGDWDIPLPLLGETLSSEDQRFDETRDPAHEVATARTWVEAFAMCLISGLIRDQSKVLGPMLHGDYAPTIRSGVPHSTHQSVSAPADLAEMDALCAYLHIVETPYSPWVAQGPAPVRKPDADQRASAAQRLDSVGELSPDQRLLRVLLDDNQPLFEQALVERLIGHRRNLEADPVPRSLLPVGPLAVTALAVLAHGWELGVRSDYLPAVLLRAPQQATTK